MPSRPPTHRPHKGDGRPSASRRGYDAKWRKARLVVLAEEPVCQDCGREPSVHVDHDERHVIGQAHDRANLRALCASCHSRKTVAVDGGLGRAKR